MLKIVAFVLVIVSAALCQENVTDLAEPQVVNATEDVATRIEIASPSEPPAPENPPSVAGIEEQADQPVEEITVLPTRHPPTDASTIPPLVHRNDTSSENPIKPEEKTTVSEVPVTTKASSEATTSKTTTKKPENKKPETTTVPSDVKKGDAGLFRENFILIGLSVGVLRCLY